MKKVSIEMTPREFDALIAASALYEANHEHFDHASTPQSRQDSAALSRLCQKFLRKQNQNERRSS